MTILRALMDVSFRPGLMRFRRISGHGSLSFFLIFSAGFTHPAEAQQQPAIPPELEDSQTTLNIRADSQQKDKESYHLRGHVEVTYQEMKLTADDATYDAPSGEIAAKGHVTFKDPKADLEAEEGQYNVRTGAGWFLNGHGYFHADVRPRPRVLQTTNPFYVQAKKVVRLDPTTYSIEGGRLSSCECEEKGWSVSARHARVKVDDKVIAHDILFRLVQIPLLYLPVFIDSIAPKPRQTGFLLPHVGNSTQKGYIVGEGFFWAINPSADLELGLENFSIRGLGRTGRFRARPSSTSQITVDYFGVNDKGSGTLRQFRAPGNSLRATGQAQDLGYGFRGVVDVDYINSLAFRQTWSDNFTEAVSSEDHQTGFLSKNFDAYSLNFYVSRYQDFLCAQQVSATTSIVPLQTCPTTAGGTAAPGNSITIRHTPSFSFSQMDKQAGSSPFYFAFDASADGVGRNEPGFETSQVSERLDFHPTLTLRSKPFWGFHFTPSVSARATRYGTSLPADQGPLNRLFGELSADLRPPSFEKVFSKPLWGFRLKHVIEPDVRYDLVRARDAENILDVVRFDQLDVLSETNEIEYSLTNSILIRKDESDGAGEKPQARELLSWRLSQKYYFDPTFGGALQPGTKTVFAPTISLTGFAFAQGRRLSPLVSVVKVAPSSNYDTELRADFSPSGGGVLNAGITSHVHRGPLGLAFTDFFINRTAALPTPLAPLSSLTKLPSFDLLRVVATYGDVNRKGLSGAIGLTYNIAQRNVPQDVGQLSYNFGCFGLDFEYSRFALGTLRRENLFRVALSLANVGTFGNLKPRERLY